MWKSQGRSHRDSFSAASVLHCKWMGLREGPESKPRGKDAFVTIYPTPNPSCQGKNTTTAWLMFEPLHLTFTSRSWDLVLDLSSSYFWNPLHGIPSLHYGNHNLRQKSFGPWQLGVCWSFQQSVQRPSNYVFALSFLKTLHPCWLLSFVKVCVRAQDGRERRESWFLSESTCLQVHWWPLRQ